MQTAPAESIDGWLAYGAALNEGRALFPSDEQFGQWIKSAVSSNLDNTIHPGEQQAAMWAAANADQLADASNGKTLFRLIGRSKNKTLYPQRTQPVSPQATFGGDPVSPQDTACIPREYVQAIFGPEPVSPEATLLESTIGMQE